MQIGPYDPTLDEERFLVYARRMSGLTVRAIAAAACVSRLPCIVHMLLLHGSCLDF